MIDSPEQLGVARRLKAASEIGEAMRSRSRYAARPNSVLTDELQDAFWELTENGPDPRAEDMTAIMDLFLDNPDLRNATLARISMGGNWKGVDEAQELLLDMAQPLAANGYDIRLLWKDSADAKLTWDIEPQLTEEFGIVAGHRKRLMMTGTGHREFEVDKLSSFALDLQLLERGCPEAAKEARTAMLYAAFLEINPDILLALDVRDEDGLRNFGADAVRTAQDQLEDMMAKAMRYGVTFREIAALVDTPLPFRLRVPEGITILEDAILAQRSVLTPAVTTFYVHDLSTNGH